MREVLGSIPRSALLVPVNQFIASAQSVICIPDHAGLLDCIHLISLHSDSLSFMLFLLQSFARSLARLFYAFVYPCSNLFIRSLRTSMCCPSSQLTLLQNYILLHLATRIPGLNSQNSPACECLASLSASCPSRPMLFHFMSFRSRAQSVTQPLIHSAICSFTHLLA